MGKVRHIAHAPSLNVAASQTALAGASVVLTATAADPEHGTISWQWTQTGGPNVTLAGAQSDSASFTSRSVAVCATQAVQRAGSDAGESD
jgi:hypothetical protein